jgi:hypothetical protein
MPRFSTRTRRARLAIGVAGLVAAPVAVAAPLDGGDRNPSSSTSSSYNRETAIIGTVAENRGGHGGRTGGYVTRQSNKSDSGGGAIYGCRAKAGTESCVAANNLSNGDAFRFQASTAAARIGQLRFGTDINKLVDKPAFVTNGTGLVENLNADRVDGKSAEDFVEKGTLLFAAVAADGTIGANRGIKADTPTATTTTENHRHTFEVPFDGDLSKCVATASPASNDATGTLVVAPLAASGVVTVIENTADASRPAYPFSLQVTC